MGGGPGKRQMGYNLHRLRRQIHFIRGIPRAKFPDSPGRVLRRARAVESRKFGLPLFASTPLRFRHWRVKADTKYTKNSKPRRGCMGDSAKYTDHIDRFRYARAFAPLRFPVFPFEFFVYFVAAFSIPVPESQSTTVFTIAQGRFLDKISDLPAFEGTQGARQRLINHSHVLFMPML
jgi:hypothetical protein